MKLLIIVGLVIAVAAEAPYPASGWRPSGPAFDLPQKNSQKPQNNYLPPDPRTPEDPDVSVQGLPVDEQRPEFVVSPVSGQQYVGPDFNADIARLNERYRQELFQIEQQRIQEILRQQTTQTPGQISRTTPKPDEKTTTESDLNEGEVAPDDQRVTVEISKQKVQEYPAELLLTPLTQIRFVKQNGQLQDQKVQGFDGAVHLAAIQSILRQNRLVQNQEVIRNQAVVNQQEGFLVVPQKVTDYQIQPVLLQPQVQYGVPENSDVEDVDEKNEQFVPQGQVQYQVPQVQPLPQQFVNQEQQFVAQQQFQTQPQQFLTQTQQFVPQQQQQFVSQRQLQGQQQLFVPQPQQFQPQQQQVYQPQEQIQQQQFQPQQQQTFLTQQQQLQPQQFQPQLQQQQQTFQTQPQHQQQAFQPQQFQPQLQQVQPQLNQQDYQNQFLYQAQYQPVQDLGQFYQNQVLVQNGQGALQSGIEVDQENGVEDKEDTTERDDDSGSATAVATAFGERTRPRVYTQYGAPVPEKSTTETPQQDEVSSTEEVPAIAVATAEARGRRKSAKLRNRRVRPVFTVDQSGHLVLTQDQ